MADGYTHDPDAFDEDGEPVSSAEVADAESPAARRQNDGSVTGTDDAEPSDREFDWRGWVLVAAIAVCFLVIPAVILAYPYVGQQLGLSFYDTYLALPMIPAVVLAVLAVWATTHP